MMIASKTKQLHGDVPAEHKRRWAAVVGRDHRADGTFFYSVETTGVYCRPSCGSRRANPKNVRFHRTSADAERAGFRPCKRCKPDQPPLEQLHAAKVAEICRAIDAADHPALFLVDTVSGLGSADYRHDEWGVDVTISG